MIKRDPWLPMKRWALAALVLILLPVACHQAQAAEVTPKGGFIFNAEECANFADMMEQAADARDAGIGARLYTTYLVKRFARYNTGKALRDVVLAEIRRAYLSGLSGERLKEDAHVRCMTGPVGGSET